MTATEQPTVATADITTSFVNEPLLELRRRSVRDGALAALAAIEARLPLDVPIVYGGREHRGEAFRSLDPHRAERVVANGQGASAAQTADAVAACERGHREWSRTPADERAAIIERAAGLLSAQRLELAALAVRECGKPWAEADGDVCEAIDFLRYYARGAAELGRGRALLQMPGERNDLRYVARGVTAVIAPWNFPLAIAAGMTTAALATGNATILKPAEQAPACAHAIVRALHEAGVPGDALALVPGGDEAGKALVADARVHQIVFTGSCAAGLSIMRAAAEPAPGQHHIKRVIAEMGGKNIIIVDDDADLDDAVPAILGSAFAFAGQKCSAASRVLACAPIADELAERLAGAIPTLRVGDPGDFATDVPPVIDAEAQARITAYLEKGRAAARETYSQEQVPDGGFHVPPTIFRDLPPDSPVVTEEIFGPVLSLETVTGIAAACDRVDESPFALTGGLFSRSPGTIATVRERTPVGNLYINREITGAIVARQPFGGGRLSGTGPKAGGPDYLMQFVEARTVTENTVRHGLVV